MFVRRTKKMSRRLLRVLSILLAMVMIMASAVGAEEPVEEVFVEESYSAEEVDNTEGEDITQADIFGAEETFQPEENEQFFLSLTVVVREVIRLRAADTKMRVFEVPENKQREQEEKTCYISFIVLEKLFQQSLVRIDDVLFIDLDQIPAALGLGAA